MLERYYGCDAPNIQTIDYLESAPSRLMQLKNIADEENDNSVTYSVSSEAPSSDDWLEALAGNKLSWLCATLTVLTIVQGTSYIANPIQQLFAPRAGQKVVLQTKDGVPSSIAACGSARSHGKYQDDFKSVEIAYNESTRQVPVTIFEERRGASVPLGLIFQYRPDMSGAPIHGVTEG